MSTEFIIYADESAKRGPYFGNFYGGVLVPSTHLNRINNELTQLRDHLGVKGEFKWQKVSAGYLPKYQELIEKYFDYLDLGLLKVRVMFTANKNVPTGLQKYHFDHSYHLLYYQFIKHAFGLEYSNPSRDSIRLRIYLDKLPDTREKNAMFKSHLASLEKSAHFRRANIRVPLDQIAEVRSHDHMILQCLDVILGAIQFRLNDFHLVKPAGRTQRGSRTIAKEKLYRLINRRIRRLYPNFNIGITTGTPNGKRDRYDQAYRHWQFIPREVEIDRSKTKQKKR